MGFVGILGFTCKNTYSEPGITVPWMNRVHWWCGRILMILAIVCLYLGLVSYSQYVYVASSTFIVFWVIIGVGIASLICGEMMYEFTSRKDRKFAVINVTRTSMISNSSSSYPSRSSRSSLPSHHSHHSRSHRSSRVSRR